ncbi:MAG TPA: efflux RND transporter periplasmic adaptor subunit [Bacteroidota bacterium]|nr:efflux RND transporter periplasmic adaptor subunit [Bacteroidota bacterium]
MFTNKKWLWIAVGAVVVLGGGFLLLNNGGGDKITYRTAKVDRGDISVVISATGTLQAVTTVQVGSQVSGTIAKLYADYNTRVKEGQLLAQLDPTFLQATVNEQRANVDRAIAQVNEAQRNYNRTADLFAKALVSQADMDAATTALESAKASLAQAKAALQRAEVNLRYATIRAPISGVVISRNVDVGQTVAASLQAPTLFTIAQDLRKMQVQASVDEADIGNVQVGQRVTFRVDAYPEREFKGVVSQIRLAPVITQNVVTYTVIIDVDNNDLKLMPGMTATVSIEVASKGDVLRVPIQAIRFTPPPEVVESLAADTANAGARRWTQGRAEGERQGGGERRFERRPENAARVWVLKDGKPVPKFVRKGLQNATHVEIVRGDINEGDEVIIGASGGAQTQMPAAQNNPFAPRFPTGGGRRGGF